MSTVPITYCLGLLSSMAAVHPWFYSSLLKSDGSQPAKPSNLEDDPYEAKAILKINKRGTHAKMN